MSDDGIGRTTRCAIHESASPGLSHELRGVGVNLLQRLLWAALTLVFAGFFASLGFWQAGRAEMKQRWFDGYDAAIVAPAGSLAGALSQPPASVPVRVQGEVSFREEPLLLLDNQQREGRVGVRVYALADVQNAQVQLLVELGWLPIGGDRSLPSVTAPEGGWVVEGLLQPWPGQGLRMMENPWSEDTREVLLTYLDRAEISGKAGVSLYDGVLLPEPSLPLGYQRDAGTMPNTLSPEKHWGYAVQWWALSATVVAVYLILMLRRRVK